jgi:hypothetical protein
VCCLLVLNLVSSTLSCIRQPRPRLQGVRVYHTGPLSYRSHFCPPSPLASTQRESCDGYCCWKSVMVMMLFLSSNAPPWVAPDPLMIGIRVPDGLVVGSQCASHPGVLGSIPKLEEPGRENRRTLCHRTGFLMHPKLCDRYCSNKHTNTIVVCTLSGGCISGQARN